MKNKIPILLITHDRSYILKKVLTRLLNYTDWNEFDLWICCSSSTPSNKKIIDAFSSRYKEINVFHQDVNQVALIQNLVIEKLKKDIYIKLDDDILVGDNWYKGFLGVYQRNSNNISIGSVVMPINGFGWTIFLDIMGLNQEFNSRFPDVKLIQGCTEPASWHDKDVSEYIWSKCLDIDLTAREFISNQESFQDFSVPYRYSIGGIIFSHEFWEKMNGWKLSDRFIRRKKLYDLLTRLNNKIANIRRKEEQKRTQQILKILTGMHESELGVEEEYLFLFSQANGYKQFVTTESIVFHFAFGPTEDYLIKNILLDIKF
jgi:hypothetical protein